MERYILACIFLLGSIAGFSQHYTKEDSSYIYKYLVYYNEVNHTFNDIDEPWIEEYHDSIPQIAEYYFYKATYIASIPAWQRVVMVSYLPYEKKKECLKWIYNRLDKKDTDAVFLFLWAMQWGEFSYGIPFSELGISPEEVKRYCKECSYR